ncbi:hypothetical protein GTO89_14950 [Heliobacterium gestii]|uniref:DUF4367 domain-containing protein n=1 Tax=Heliomicrobium gestii TaxID=2699 RepID=A0A845LFI9_HELGE|nr:hypothetical protein [Heliomicrobium gestii]MBM7868143.1 hypothetical protein [Heliomicrobium gestii]MZP44331.1 hypothetical protein [Heliomicrobium gestii]
MNRQPERFLDRQIEETVRQMVEETPVPPIEASWARLEQKRREQASLQAQPQPLSQTGPRPRPLFLRWAAVAAAALVVGGLMSSQWTGSTTTAIKTASIVGNAALDNASDRANTPPPPSPSLRPAAPASAAPASATSGAVAQEKAAMAPVSASVAASSAKVSAVVEPGSPPAGGSAPAVGSATLSTASPPVSTSADGGAQSSKEERRVALAVPARGDDVSRPAPAAKLGGDQSDRSMGASPQMGAVPLADQQEAAALSAVDAAPPLPAAQRSLSTFAAPILSAQPADVVEGGAVVGYLPPGFVMLAAKERMLTEPTTSRVLRYVGPASSFFNLTVGAAAASPAEGTPLARRDVELAGEPGKLALFAKGLLRIEWRRDKAFYMLEGILPEEEAIRVAQSIR